MKIYLVTHAHTEQQPGAAADTWQLSARGAADARRLAACDFWREIDRVVVSSEPKTWLTVAEVVAARGLPVWVDSRFDELRRTGWIEDYAAQVAMVFANPFTGIGGWEAADHVRGRVLAALDALQRRYHPETLAVIGHGLCLSILRAAVLGQQEGDFDAWQRLPFAGYAAITVTPRALIQDFILLEHGAR